MYKIPENNYRIIRLPEVKKIVGLSRSSIYEYISKNNFPKPIKIGTKSSGWLEDEINSWVKGRITASRGTAL